MRGVLVLCLALLAAPAQATLHSTDLMALLRQAASDASSAVPPLRMPERKAPRVVTGKFSGDAIDSLVITENGTAYCKGAKPDPRNCQPINGLSASSRTVPITDDKGRTVLLQFEGMTQAQVCSINAAGFRASLDCRALDARKFPEYRGILAADGKALMLDANDGKYLCTEAGGKPTCLHILDRNGKLPQPKTRKQFELQMKPVVYNPDDMFDTSRFEAWQTFIYGEIDGACGWGGCTSDSWFSDRWNYDFYWYPPGPDRDRCFAVCDQKQNATQSVCGAAAGAACIGGAIVAGVAGCAAWGGAVGVACLGGAGVGDLICRHQCYR